MTTTTRAVGVGGGWRWLAAAANLGARAPGTVFGGAALLLALVFAGVFAIALVGGGATALVGQGSGAGAAMVIAVVLVLGLLWGMAGLSVGYLRLVDAVEHGRPTSIATVFSGFSPLSVSLRAFVFIVLLAIVQNLLLGLAMFTLAPDFAALYMQMLQASAAGAAPPAITEPPAGFWPAMAVSWLVSLFFYAVQAIGLCEIALRDRGVAGAAATGASGAVKNLPALLLLLLIAIALAIVAVIVVFLLALLGGLLASAVGNWILFALGVPLYLLVVLVLVVFAFGLMYSIWREVCGGDATGIATVDDGRHVEL